MRWHSTEKRLTMAVNIISLNVRGLGDYTKRRSIFNHYRDRCKILLLQETHSCVEKETQWRNEWGGRILFSHGDTNARGVAILFHKQFFCNILSYSSDKQGRYVMAKLEIDGETICLTNIYAPNKDSPGFFQEVFRESAILSEKLIVCGDFNTVLDNNLDRSNQNGINNNNATDAIKNLCEELQLTDIWRERNEQSRRYSWFRRGARRSASRLDYSLVSQGLSKCVMEVCYLHGLLTDHSAHYLGLDIIPYTRGAGFWKLNCKYLQDVNYVNHMKETLENKIKECEGVPVTTKWEILKRTIKDTSQTYTRENANLTNVAIAELSEKITDFEDRYLDLSEEEEELLQRSKLDLQELVSEKMQGVLFRSKAQWYAEGERNTKYFYSLEKMRYNAKTCTALISEDNGEQTVHTCQEEILEMQHDFFQTLYSKEHGIEFKMENTENLKFPENTLSTAETQLSITEIETALANMKNGKTPGPDGIPIDFYKKFWNTLKNEFYTVLMDCYTEQKLYSSAMTGVINVIPKAGKDSRFLTNLRPITLLNADYKLIEKTISNRILSGLHEVIHQDQKGFLPGRRITTNIRKVLDIIAHTDREGIEAFILSLDFSKCFDKISFEAVFGSLNYFGCSNIIINWVHMLYTGFTVKVQNNGNFSKQIDIQRGVRQGGCASTTIFLCCAELLAIELRKDTRIQGIPVKEIAALLGQYADDMDSFQLNSAESLQAFLEQLGKFHSSTGFAVNYNKTCIYRIGSLRHSRAELYTQEQISWTEEDVGLNILGVHICHDEETMLNRNYQGIIQKVQSTIQQWKPRKLSLIGKVEIINTLIHSQFAYKMMVLPNMPPKMIRELDKLVQDFLWDNKRPKIPLAILQLQKPEGGLNLASFTKREKALKASWVNFLHTELVVEEIAYGVLHPTLRENLWKCNVNADDVHAVMCKKDQFWENVFTAWSEFNYSSQTTPDQMLWLNSNIKVGNKPIFYKNAWDMGLKTIEQLLDQDKLMSREQAAQKYCLTPMQYNSIISALPADLKSLIRDGRQEEAHTEDKYHLITHSKSAVKTIYQKLCRDDEPSLLRKCDKWNAKLGIHIDYDEFLELFNYAHHSCKVAKYQSFQYRLLLRAIPTNVDLKIWKMRDHDTCSFCNTYTETYEHLFVSCQTVCVFWKAVAIRLSELGIISVYAAQKLWTANAHQILFNTVHDSPVNILNFMCLTLKQYIYRQRCWSERLEPEEAVKNIINAKNCEKYYATKNLKLDKFNRRWHTD